MKLVFILSFTISCLFGFPRLVYKNYLYQVFLGLQSLKFALSQLQTADDLSSKFVSTVLSQIQWSPHLRILNKTKTAEEKIFHILHAISQRLSVRELKRQLNTATFERSILSNKIVSAVATS